MRECQQNRLSSRQKSEIYQNTETDLIFSSMGDFFVGKIAIFSDNFHDGQALSVIMVGGRGYIIIFKVVGYIIT